MFKCPSETLKLIKWFLLKYSSSFWVANLLGTQAYRRTLNKYFDFNTSFHGQNVLTYLLYSCGYLTKDKRWRRGQYRYFRVPND